MCSAMGQEIKRWKFPVGRKCQQFLETSKYFAGTLSNHAQICDIAISMLVRIIVMPIIQY